VAGPRDHQSSPFLEEIAPTICRFDFVALCVASSAGFRHLPRKTRIVLRATLSSTGYDGLGVAPFTPRVHPPGRLSLLTILAGCEVYDFSPRVK
jgi:hypothetical protein